MNVRGSGCLGIAAEPDAGVVIEDLSFAVITGANPKPEQIERGKGMVLSEFWLKLKLKFLHRKALTFVSIFVSLKAIK